MNIMSDKYYSLEEVAKILKVTSRSVQNYLKEGKLTGKKFGGRWNFTKDDIIQYIKHQNKEFLDDSIFNEKRENYCNIIFNYFYETENVMRESMEIILDNFNNYKKKSPEICCRMVCETKGNNKIEVNYIGKEEEILALIEYLSERSIK